MVQDTIKAVKEAEEQAAEILKDASEKGRALIEDAKKQAEQVKDDALKSVKSKKQEADGDQVKQGEAYLAKSMEEAKAEIAGLEAGAAQKTDTAVEAIISELI